MSERYSTVRATPYFAIADGLNRENRSDFKVGMVSEIDMSSAGRLRGSLHRETGVKPSYTALVMKALALALRAHPHMNRIPTGFFRHRIAQLRDVDVNVAVEKDELGKEQSVFVGTIRQTDNKDLAAITRELADLANATPATNKRWATYKWLIERCPRRLALLIASIPRWFPSLWVEHRGGGALVSSPAKYGVDLMVGTWAWPLGFSFGLVKDRPIVVEKELVVRPTMALTLSFDRRMWGGAPAARFFATVCRFLQDAETWLIKTGEQIPISDEYQRLSDEPEQPRKSDDRLAQTR